ncbi:MAG: GlxA family transcriptional regulator [Paracoccaceae bacterium]
MMLNVSKFEPQICASSKTPCKVVIVVIDGVSLTTVSATIEPFQQANTLLNAEKFKIQLLSLDDADPITSAGIPIPCQNTSSKILDSFSQREKPDLLILCCGQSIRPHDQPTTKNLVRKMALQNIPIFALGASCAVIAQSAIAKGTLFATHWKNSTVLAEQFPEYDFQNVIYVNDDRASSCPGEFAAFDFMLDFIERKCGSHLSGELHNHFLSPGRRSGCSVQLLSGDAYICKDPRFQRVLKIMVANIEMPVPVSEIARQLGYSVRQIERVFSSNGFGSPNKYYVNLRLDRARQLLEQTHMPLSEIALACGFNTQSRLSKCYKRKFGVLPRSHRYRINHFGL